jgi:hypothetical protein
MGDMGDIPEPSYPLSNPRRNSMEGDMQVRLFNHTRGCQKGKRVGPKKKFRRGVINFLKLLLQVGDSF